MTGLREDGTCEAMITKLNACDARTIEKLGETAIKILPRNCHGAHTLGEGDKYFAGVMIATVKKLG